MKYMEIWIESTEVYHKSCPLYIDMYHTCMYDELDSPLLSKTSMIVEQERLRKLSYE